jgi:hypothetical protein
MEKTFILMKEAFEKNDAKAKKRIQGGNSQSVDLNLVQNCLNLFQVLYNHHKTVQSTKEKFDRFREGANLLLYLCLQLSLDDRR